MQKELLSEFIMKSCALRKEILQAQKDYLKAKKDNDVVKKKFNEVSEKVLKKYPFYAMKDCERMKIKKGDRVLKSNEQFLLSDEEFNRYMELCKTEFHEAGLTDKAGYYTYETNTEERLKFAEEELLELTIKALPKNFPNKRALNDAIVYKGKNSFETRQKLLELALKQP